MSEKTARIVEIHVDNAAAIKGIAEYNALIDESCKAERALRDEIKKKGEATGEEGKQLAEMRIKQTAYKQAVSELGREVQNNIKAARAQEGSNVKLRAQLSNLTKEYDTMGEAMRTSVDGEGLKKKINEITDALKSSEEDTQRYYRNVGNYAGGFKTVLSQQVPIIGQAQAALAPFGKLLNDTGAALRDTGAQFMETARGTVGLSVAQKAATITSGLLTAGLKILKIALISTGIGAIVVLLGSLIAYFSKTQTGVESLSKVTAALGAAFDVIVDRLAKFGGALVKLFSGDFKGAASDMKAAFSGIGEEIMNDATQAMRLKQRLIELDKADASLTARRASEKVQISELKRISDDVTKSTAERIAAAQQALDIEQRTAAELNANGEARIANMLGYTEVTDEVRKQIELLKSGAADADKVIANLGLAESTFGDFKTLTEEIAKYQQGVQEFTTMSVEGITKINTIRAEAAAKRKQEQVTELAAVRAAVDAEIAILKDGVEKDRRMDEEGHTRKVADLQTRLDSEKGLTKTAREAITQQIELAERQHEANMAALTDKALLDKIDKEAELIALRLDVVKKGSDEEYSLRVEQLNKQAEAELSNAHLTAEQRLLIEAKYQADADALRDQHTNDGIQKAQDAMRLEWENKINEAALQGQNTLQIELQQREAELAALQQMEGESDAEFKARQLELSMAHVEAKKAINDYEVEIEQAKQQAIGAVIGSLGGLLEEMGENNKAFAIASKAIALGEIAVNTGKAIAAGIAQSQSVPFPGNLIAVATTVATVIANITSAIKTVKSAKFASGGYVEGPGTSTSDSIPAHLSRGESVNNALSTSMFTPIYSALNQMGGGVPIVATQTSSQIAGEDMLARAVMRGMAGLDLRIGVDEINRVQSRVAIVESLGYL